MEEMINKALSAFWLSEEIQQAAHEQRRYEGSPAQVHFVVWSALITGRIR
jgi:hypothetical protein